MGQDDATAAANEPPVPPALAAFMATGWADGDDPGELAPVAAWAAKRRAALTERFPGERLVVPAGAPTSRNVDVDHRFRADSAHVYLTGNQASDAVLLMDDGTATLFVRPRAPRSEQEFWRDRRYGEFWAGRRPSLAETQHRLGLDCRHLDELPAALASGPPARLLRGVDPRVDALAGTLSDAPGRDAELAAAISQLRLVKDSWEVEQLRAACAATARGFEDCLREWPQVLAHGERWIEGTFWRRARVEGNDVGYTSIVASGPHATTLHWIDDDGPVRPGELLLLDMGVETRSLYTADISRTLPVSGRFTGLQRDLYTLVLRAQDAGIAAVRPGARFRAYHEAAMTVLAHGLADLGLLPVSAEQALDPESALYRRWTLHGSGHMLGLDVHDCTTAPAAAYADGTLEAGNVLTVEPGLYLQADDLLVPEELRGIGIRVEDDLLVTDAGAENLSAALPREPGAVETWMAGLLR
ncbi:aminopeptidase P family protein [Jiangella ureilytica]|nr:aminopeptidase P family protein [Jiangella ureilytica]